MVKEEPVHKELNPLQLVQDYKFQKQYLSLDRYYGSFVQDPDLDDLEAKADPEEYNTNAPVESQSLKQFQFSTAIFFENPVSRYIASIFHDIETHVNEFKGLMQWDVLVSYYILFSINEVYCETLESDFANDGIRNKIKEWVGPDVLDRGLDDSFREYMKYFFLTLDIPKVKNSDLAKFSIKFVKEFLDNTLDLEKSMQDEDAEERNLVVMPDVNSLDAYLDVWKISFKALAVSFKKYFDTGASWDFYKDSPETKFYRSLFEDFFDVLLPNDYQWYNLEDYKQEKLVQILFEMGDERHYWRNDGSEVGKEIISGHLRTPPIPQEVIQLAEEFK